MMRWTVKLITPAWMDREDREFTTDNRYEAMRIADRWRAQNFGCVQFIDNAKKKINPFY